MSDHPQVDLSALPRDLRDRIPVVPASPAPTTSPDGRKFIGAATREYPAGPSAVPGAQPGSAEWVARDMESDAKPEAKTTPCTSCGANLDKAVRFCSSCGAPSVAKKAAEILGITISDDDIAEYIFKGFVAKAITLFKGHVATFKTLQANDLKEIDQAVSKHFDGRNPLGEEFVNYRQVEMLARVWIKLDGSVIGETVEKRLEYVERAGAHLVDITSKKYALFNRAMTEALQQEELVKNS